MQYIKHYYVNDETNQFCLELPDPRYKRHPWKEYPGLDVRIWLSDSDGVDMCISALPDETTVTTIADPSGKNSVKVLTDTEYNSVATPYEAAMGLFAEARQALENGDEATAAAKQADGDVQMADALTAIRAL